MTTVCDLFPQRNGIHGTEIIYNPAYRLAYVTILKNAHSWASELFYKNLGGISTNTIPGITKTIIILRHPLDRWISGAAQFFSAYSEKYLDLLDDPDFRSLLSDMVRFDPHTTSQVDALWYTNISQAIFFKCNDELEQNLIRFISSVKYVGMENIINNASYNRAEEKIFKHQLKVKLSTILKDDLTFRNKILAYYESDMKLISYVNENNLWYSPNTKYT